MRGETQLLRSKRAALSRPPTLKYAPPNHNDDLSTSIVESASSSIIRPAYLHEAAATSTRPRECSIVFSPSTQRRKEGSGGTFVRSKYRRPLAHRRGGGVTKSTRVCGRVRVRYLVRERSRNRETRLTKRREEGVGGAAARRGRRR